MPPLLFARRYLSSVLLLLGLLAFRPCSAQFFNTTQTNVTTFRSPVDPSIVVKYKIPNGVCTTAFSTQQQYTGWVNIPGPYPSHMFFWFVAARQPSSLLTLWLNGGPGSSSMFGFFEENGPCEIVEGGPDNLTTVARTWGWDRVSNMLFVDQPIQVGFSYDVPTNGSQDLITGNMEPLPAPLPSDRPAGTFLNGTFSSMNPNATANTTETAAYAVWHMLQGFLAAFPQYNPPSSALGVNLFTESYGGKYGPVFADVWEEQNDARLNSAASNSTVDIHLTSLGIVNGCVDDLIQAPYYPVMAVNNTYGFEAITPLRATLANASFYAPNGCQQLIEECRAAELQYDPTDEGNANSVNSLCAYALSTCQSNLMDPYSDAGRSFYDIAHELPESFPPSNYIDYLNSQAVLSAIGSVVNYTDVSSTVYSAFVATGDWERGPLVPRLADLLARGVRVGLLYGDRDYVCNWMGGEAVSLAVAAASVGNYSAAFPAAGYAPIIVNNSYIGGAVRQFGNLSFSRIYQAGHFVAAYQPETAFQVFARIVMGTDVSTGEPIDLATHNSSGPASADSSLSLPASPTATCYLRALASSCTQDQLAAILKAEGVFINGVWYSAASDWPGASSTSSASGSAATSSSASPTLTGLFTATATPSSSAVLGPDPPSAAALAFLSALLTYWFGIV